MRTLINIDVPDLAAAIEFYTTAFDLEQRRILDDDVAELVGASSIIYLLQKQADSNAAANSSELRHYSRHWTPVHLDFVVDEINAAANRLLTAGASQESECVEWRGSKCITFSDPFGHGLCLIEFTGDSYE